MGDQYTFLFKPVYNCGEPIRGLDDKAQQSMWEALNPISQRILWLMDHRNMYFSPDSTTAFSEIYHDAFPEQAISQTELRQAIDEALAQEWLEQVAENNIWFRFVPHELMRGVRRIVAPAIIGRLRKPVGATSLQHMFSGNR